MMASSTDTSATGSPYLSRASSQTSFENYVEEQQARMQQPTTTSQPVRRIVFVGAGYVGGPTAAVIAYNCPQISVTVVDKSADRIQSWQSRHLPIHEPGLKEIVRTARDGSSNRNPNLFFSTDCDRHIAQADVIFIAVNTPTKTVGIGAGAATDISMFEAAASSVAQVAKSGAIIVEKSTVPCRTAEMVKQVLTFHRPGVPFEVLSNPEFLAEGTAIRDLMHPSRILIGSGCSPQGIAAAARLAEVYAHWVPRSSILTIDIWSSELAKLVANAMLAQRISSINTVSAICERTGANVDNVAQAIGLDPRLGSKFLRSGLGFGGSCFKKDILSLSYLGESLELHDVAQYWRAVVEINEWQCQRFVKGVLRTLNGSLRGKKVTLLGYAFKKDTSDTRESQATEVVRMLLRESPCEIALFDPQCDTQHIEEELGSLLSTDTQTCPQPSGPVSVYENPYEAAKNSSAILILTEWDHFRFPPIAPLHPVRPNLLSLDAVERHDSVQDGLPTLLSVGAEMSCNVEVTTNAEPKCEVDCRQCLAETTIKATARESLDWTAVAKLMRGERWVFDGRGVVEQAAMEKLGFLVRGIGRADTRSRFR